jgi:hypothetical protein
MANRIIYQSDALFASQKVDSVQSGEHVQLQRVQSANYSFNVNRTDVNQFGQLARTDSLILESPTVSADVTYLLGNGFNEEALGFSLSSKFTDASLSTGFLAKQISATDPVGTSGKNLYILTLPEGIDANTVNSRSTNVAASSIGIGNAYLTDYTLDASVGDFPTVSVSFEGLNANATSSATGMTGANAFNGAGNAQSSNTITGFAGMSGVGVDPTAGTQLTLHKAGTTTSGIGFPTPNTGNTPITALKPGDMTLTLSAADGKSFYNIDGVGGGHVQSVSLNVPLSRTPIEKLGSTFAFARVADFPITPTLSVSAVVNEANEQALHDIVADDSFIANLDLAFGTKPGGLNADQVVRYRIKNAKLDSESVSSSIGPNKTVDMTFSVSVGGPDDSDNNVFMSGSNGSTIAIGTPADGNMFTQKVVNPG